MIFSNRVILLLLILVLASCISQNTNATVNDKRINLEKKYTDRFQLNLVYDTVSSQFSMKFSDTENIFENEYLLREDGSLRLRIGTNFWGETEKYFFDINGSLKEYRKLVNLTNKKAILQEFISYQNGIINRKKSHYFDYNLVDSTINDYKIHVEYLGGFQIDTLELFIDDFDATIRGLKLTNRIYFGTKNEASFWVPKKAIYDQELDYFQLNVEAHFSDQALTSEQGAFTQIFILRKFRNNMNNR